VKDEDEVSCGSFVRSLPVDAPLVLSRCPNNPAYRLSAILFSLILFHLPKYLDDRGARNMLSEEEEDEEGLTLPPDLKNEIFSFNASDAFLRLST
jgi:hypothetical protein